MSLFQAFHSYPAFLVGTVVVFSLAIGSFLNVVIHRLPIMLERQWRAELAEHLGEHLGEQAADGPRYNLVVPRSQCPVCGHRITALENIPLASYLFLGGKCSACKARISPRYPVVEALTAGLSGYIAWRYGMSWQLPAVLVFAWAMIALAFIDLDTFYLPDDITLPLLWAGLLANMAGMFVDLQSAVIGAAAGYLALWLVYWAYKFATGKEGMGYGDFKLLAAIGAWLGYKFLLMVVLLSSFVGALVGISLMIFWKHGRDIPIPFGPYLAAAGLIALLWRGEICVRITMLCPF